MTASLLKHSSHTPKTFLNLLSLYTVCPLFFVQCEDCVYYWPCYTREWEWEWERGNRETTLPYFIDAWNVCTYDTLRGSREQTIHSVYFLVPVLVIDTDPYQSAQGVLSLRAFRMTKLFSKMLKSSEGFSPDSYVLFVAYIVLRWAPLYMMYFENIFMYICWCSCCLCFLMFLRFLLTLTTQ